MNIVPNIVAGDTLSWHDDATSLPDGTVASSTSHNLQYSFRGPVVSGNVDVNAVADGNGWKTTLTGVITSAFNTASTILTWYWQATAIAISGGARYSCGRGTLRVKPNLASLATSAVYDGSTQAEKDLAAVETEINARINGGLTYEYSIGSRSLKKEPMPALLALRTQLKLQIAQQRRSEAIANGLGDPTTKFVRFRR